MGIVYTCASMFDTLILKLNEFQLVDAKFMISLKGRSHMCLNVLSPSQCTLCAIYLEPNDILFYDNTLDEVFTLDSFLYYIFAYDDIDDGFGFTLS